MTCERQAFTPRSNLRNVTVSLNLLEHFDLFSLVLYVCRFFGIEPEIFVCSQGRNVDFRQARRVAGHLKFLTSSYTSQAKVMRHVHGWLHEDAK